MEKSESTKFNCQKSPRKFYSSKVSIKSFILYEVKRILTQIKIFDHFSLRRSYSRVFEFLQGHERLLVDFTLMVYLLNNELIPCYFATLRQARDLSELIQKRKGQRQ
jgi:hypothetical protein